MLPISPKLMERLEKKLGVRRRRLYELILDVATSRLVERDTAALILAAEQKIPIRTLLDARTEGNDALRPGIPSSTDIQYRAIIATSVSIGEDNSEEAGKAD